MPAIGITGGIATGKSAFADCLRQLLPNATFFNADAAARELTDSDPEVRKEIESAFGRDAYSDAGDLNRAALRAIILASPAKRRALEQILHPRIRRRWSAHANNFRNCSDFFFADIPLLYETGGETLCDRVVVLACAPEIQLARLVACRGMSADEGRKMIQTQMPLSEKIGRADHVVWNNCGRDVLETQAELLVGLWQTEEWTKA